MLARAEAIAESIAPDDGVRRPSHKWDIAPTAHTDAIAVAMGLADPQAIPKSPILDGLLYAERQCRIHGGCQFNDQGTQAGSSWPFIEQVPKDNGYGDGDFKDLCSAGYLG